MGRSNAQQQAPLHERRQQAAAQPDAFASALAVVQQELAAMPRRKTETAIRRAQRQTYDRCIERLHDDPAARALVKRYGLFGFYTSSATPTLRRAVPGPWHVCTRHQDVRPRTGISNCTPSDGSRGSGASGSTEG